MRAGYLLLVAWMGLGLSQTSWGATRYVSLTGSSTPPYTSLATAATNIQMAINASAQGDEILVAPGVYAIRSEIQIPIATTLSLRGTQGRDAVIDAQRLSRCMYVLGTNSLVEGFTFKNGLDNGHGGGVYLGRKSTLRNCLVVSNEAWGAAGVMINNCAAVVEDCTIEHNYARYYAGGVAFYNFATGLVNRCIIQRNVASNYAGGVIFQTVGTVSNSWIADNRSSNNAAGVYMDYGGRLVNSVVVGNWAKLDSGGIFAVAGTLIHCTIVGNQAGVRYGGGYMGGVTSWNSIVYFNTAPATPDALITGSQMSNNCTSLALGGSNFTNAPAFADFAARNFRLAEGSSCIDAGQALPTVARDYDGTTRPQAGVLGGAALYDVGAYEFVPQAKQYFSPAQPVIGYAKKDWSFMTAWNLSNGRLEVSPRWYNGNSTFTYTLDTAFQWVAIFLYDEGTSQTRELRWAHRQAHIQ